MSSLSGQQVGSDGPVAAPAAPAAAVPRSSAAGTAGAGFSPPPRFAGAAAVAGTAGTAAAAAGAATAGTGPGSHLLKKIQKALTMRVDSQASREALMCLSGFFDENTVHTRRNLRSTIEGQSLFVHQEFITKFGVLEKEIAKLDKLVGALDKACESATTQLRTSRSETQAIMEKASTLRKESKVIEEKQEVLSKFLARFRLSEADTQLVRSGDQPLDADFFDAFERLEAVRTNARQMLNTCGQQTSGVDILHETSEILEASYERMFLWVQQQGRGPKASLAKSSPTELDTPAGAVLKRVLALLVERPVYFNHCIRDLARVRQQALVQRFFEALSHGDASGSRPIELQACDPVRYVGDMLAWIHENAASEREALSALMGGAARAAGGAAGEAAAGGGAAAAAPAGEAGTALVSFQDILDFTLEGLVNPFSNRVKQVLEVQSSIVVVYKVAQLFSFFAKTLEDVLCVKESCLVSLCKDSHARTYQAFLDMWEAQAQRLRQGVVGVYVSELAAPPFVMEAVNTLSEVLSIYEMALVPASEREADFLPILSAAFDPLLNHCQQVAAMMDPADGQVFLINCVAAMQAPLRKHDFTAQRVTMYAALLDDQVQLLVDGQASAVLAKLGLAERLKALREKPPDVPLSAVPELHLVSLAATLRSFYNSLFTLGGALALPLLERIANRNLRTEARSGVARCIATAYEELYNGVVELGVATHTPEQVRTLLE